MTSDTGEEGLRTPESEGGGSMTPDQSSSREAVATAVASEVATAAASEEHHDPPYILIWVVLLVLTLAEVGYAFLDVIPKFWLATGLIVMAIWKALLVAMYYMHLRFEPKRLWVLAVSPLPLVVILLVAVLQEF